MFAISDAKLFYTSHMEGKQPDGPFQRDTIAKSVVERLSQHIYGSNRNVTTDNWFTSIELAESLKTNKLTFLGTIRKNKRQLPSDISKKGKNVLLLSTMHHGDDINCRNNKSEMIMAYNETKGGVDKLCAQYNCARATRRWPFYSVLNVVGINAFVIYNGNNPESRIPRKKFLLNLSMALMNDYQKERAVSTNLP